MSIDPKLETYLNRLDKALGQVPVSDRAEIVTEIKGHVVEAQSRDPGKTVDSILASLGEPEGVANKYLMERGLKPGRAPRGNMAKWLTIGFLGTLGMVVLFVTIVLWRFTPIISVDETKGEVKILGGAIHIRANDDNVSLKTIGGGMDLKKI